MGMLRQSARGKILAVRNYEISVVLQFAAASTEDFDRLVALEDTLIGELDDLATVDGHDFGLGEFNIFILTDDPAESFDKAHRVLADQGVPNAMHSAYRQLDGEDYVILWPSSLGLHR